MDYYGLLICFSIIYWNLLVVGEVLIFLLWQFILNEKRSILFSLSEPCGNCSKTFKPFDHNNITKWTPRPECSCKTGKQQCGPRSYGPEPKRHKTASNDYVYDVTGRSMSDYLVKTTDDFVRQRYSLKSIKRGLSI